LISNHFRDSVGGPEKAGVGGSIPSLATIPFNNLASLENRIKISRAYNTHTSIALEFTFASLVQIASTFISPCCSFRQCVAAPASPERSVTRPLILRKQFIEVPALAGRAKLQNRLRTALAKELGSPFVLIATKTDWERA